MKFSSITGQRKLKEKIIENINNGRVSHAQLFLGNEGAGSLALALAYFQYLCCENKLDTDSCGECSSCKKHQKMIHPDLHFIFPTNKVEKREALSNNFLVEWRSFVLNNPYQNLFDWVSALGIENKQASINVEEAEQIILKLKLRPYESKYKMMVIWLAEKMNTQAANKILKILEEPEGQTVFILISESQEDLLPTIISRTQTINIPPISAEEMKEHLVTHFQLENDKALDISNISNGNYCVAMELLSETTETGYNNFEQYKFWMRSCYSQKILELLKWTDEISSTGREVQKNFIQYALKNVRDNLAISVNAPETSRTTKSESEFSVKFHQFIHIRNIRLIHDELTKAYSDIERNVNSKMVFFDLSLKLCGHLRILNN